MADGLFAAMLKIICAKAKDVVILHSANSALSVDGTIKAPEKREKGKVLRHKKEEKRKRKNKTKQGKAKAKKKHRKSKEKTKQNKKTNQRCQKTETRRESC